MSRTGSRRAALDFQKMYFKDLNREFLPDLLRKDGEFLLRRGGGGRVLSVNCGGKIMHYKFGWTDKAYYIESRKFPTLEQLIDYYYESGQPLTTPRQGKHGPAPTLKTPVYNTFDLIDSERLQFKEVLGKGNFGEVWKAVLLPERETVAIKILAGNTSEKDRNECMAEAKVMSILSHENVVTLKGLSFWTQAPGTLPRLLIVIEFCNYGALEKLLEKGLIEDRGKVRSLIDSAKGLEYLHKRDIIHRDIASRNCLVNKTGNKFTVKIADFGLSRLAPEHYELATKRRLPIFSTAPDTMKAREWTSASDVYSYGILMHEVYNMGKNPYEKHFLEQNANLKQIITTMEGNWRLPVPSSMPKEIGELAIRCLKKAPERPTMSEIVVTLKQIYAGMILP